MQQNPQQVELFVIQRCWFSGPHHEPSMDCRRLFTSRREAEEVAYHSAHAFANQSILARNQAPGPTRPQLNASVRTILLPTVSSTNGRATSSHAFQTCGKLFWVRPLQATIVPHVATSQSAGLTYPVHVPTLAMATANTSTNTSTTGPAFPFATAEVILTENIIGGTGNPNSRRGSEVAEGRVFVSTDASNANRCGVEAARHLHLSMAHNPHVTMTVLCLPIGKQVNNANHQHHHNCVVAAEDWPAAPAVVNGHHYQQQQQQDFMMMEDPSSNSSNKNHRDDWEYVENYDPRANQSLPAKKRRCQSFRQESPHKQESASSVPCSMMFG